MKSSSEQFSTFKACVVDSNVAKLLKLNRHTIQKIEADHTISMGGGPPEYIYGNQKNLSICMMRCFAFFFLRHNLCGVFYYLFLIHITKFNLS